MKPRPKKIVINANPVPLNPSDSINQQIEAVKEMYRDLSAYGFYFRALGDWNDEERCERDREFMQTPDFVLQVITCLEALSQPRTRRSTLWRIERHSSYVLKHEVERWVRENNRLDLASYISNGAFITAAIIDGWTPVITKVSGPNCNFCRERAR